MKKIFNFTGIDSCGNEPVSGVIMLDDHDRAVIRIQYFGQTKSENVTDRTSFTEMLLRGLELGEFLNEDRAVCILQYIIRVLIGDCLTYDRVLIVRTM